MTFHQNRSRIGRLRYGESTTLTIGSRAIVVRRSHRFYLWDEFDQPMGSTSSVEEAIQIAYGNAEILC